MPNQILNVISKFVSQFIATFFSLNGTVTKHCNKFIELASSQNCHRMLSVAEIMFAVTKIGNFHQYQSCQTWQQLQVGKFYRHQSCQLDLEQLKLYIPDFPDDDNGGITLSHPIVNMMGQLLIKTNKIYYRLIRQS